MRYLDLAYSDGVLPRFFNRTKIVASIRDTLAGQGFVEVEGPDAARHCWRRGGAAVQNASQRAWTCRCFCGSRLELHLKRLLVGGIERVYELGRVYRNEGISPRHNPEFTMLEAYQAYGDYRSMMELTEKLIVDAFAATGGRPTAAVGRGHDRLHAAVRPQDLRRAVRRAHRAFRPATRPLSSSWPTRSAWKPPASIPT